MTVKYDHAFRNALPTLSVRKIITDHNYTNYEVLIHGLQTELLKDSSREMKSTQKT